jgi:hypothetical protein
MPILFLRSAPGISDAAEKRQTLRLMKLASHNFGENLRDQACPWAHSPSRSVVRRAAAVAPARSCSAHGTLAQPPRTRRGPRKRAAVRGRVVPV